MWLSRSVILLAKEWLDRFAISGKLIK